MHSHHITLASGGGTNHEYMIHSLFTELKIRLDHIMIYVYIRAHSL